MKRLRKYLAAGCLAVVVLTVIAIALFMGSRRLTASDAVRKRITTEAARLTGGTLRYKKLALHLAPLPHLTALKVDFQIPEKVSLTTASLEVYPNLAALLSGAFELGDIVIVRPSVRVEQTWAPAKNDSNPPPVPGKKRRETVAAVFGALARLGPDLTIKVKDGTVALIRPEKQPFSIEQINLRLNSRRKEVALKLGCRTGFSEKITFRGRADLKTRSSSGRLKLDGLNARALLAELPPLPGIALSDTRLGLEAVFSARADEEVQARVTCRVPEVRIQRQQRRLTLQNVFLRGDITANQRQLAWDIKSLEIGSRAVDLGSSGTFTFGSRKKPAVLALHAVGRRIDVAAVAHGFTAFAGDQDWVQSAFTVAREGILTRATCRLAARDTDAGWAVARIGATGRLDHGLITIPGANMNLEEVSGEVVLENRKVDFKQMRGRLPYGTFGRLDARIDWHQAATLEIASPLVSVSLEKFYPWLTAFDGLQDLHKFITVAEGELDFAQLEIEGPLASPKAWAVKILAGVRDVTITSPKLAGPLFLPRGNGEFKSQTLAFEKLHLKYLDADTVASCRILGALDQPQGLRLSLDGAVGKQALAWLHRALGLPENIKIQPPLKIAGMDLQWDARGHVAIAGEVDGTGGTRVVADAVFTPGRWQVNRFELNDGISDLSLKLTRTGRHIELDYNGRLQKETLDRILEENNVLKGWVAGKLQASLDANDFRASQFTGMIEGEGLIVQGLPIAPFEFERFSLECLGKNARLQSADLVIAGTSMRLDGTAGIAAKGYTFDLDLAANSLDAAALARIRKAVPEDTAGKLLERGSETIPLNGVIHFKTPRFTVKHYTWTPLHADIVIQPETVKVTTTRAELCGISTPGTVTVDPAGWHLAFKPEAAGQNLQTTWECLQTRPMKADGLFNLNGAVESSGPAAADLLGNLKGDLSFSSDDGLIRRSSILTKIFAFLNLTEVFAGRSSGLSDKGFGYSTIRAHAAIKAGILDFDEILVDGHAMKISGAGKINLVDEKISMTLLLAPLKTFDRLIKKVPVVGYITGGSVLSVPVRIEGDTANPQVTPLAPGAVGRGLVGILERTLEAPLKIVESLPGVNSKSSPPAQKEGEKGKVPVK